MAARSTARPMSPPTGCCSLSQVMPASVRRPATCSWPSSLGNSGASAFTLLRLARRVSGDTFGQNETTPGRSSMTIRVVALGATLALCLSACAPRPGEEASVAEHAAVSDATHPGQQVYAEWCASCHDNTEQSGAPSLEAIRQLNRATVRYALEFGYMSQQAKNVPKEELERLIDWIPSAEGTNDGWIQQASCPIKLRQVRLEGAPRTSTTF